MYCVVGSSTSAVVCSALAIAVIGFLVWNFPPARIFMGDAGSGFAADIAVDAPEGLFIGTKAKAEIIIFSKENVYSVPIDAIKTGDDGKSYVVIKQADGKFTDSEVTTGTANEFYTEVSGKDIKDGTEVLANAQWADLAAAQSSSAAQGGF